MSWHTVPNFFPDYEHLDSLTKYHLSEGYCIDDYLTKYSGKHYKKVKCLDNDEFHTLISYLGFREWHFKWELKTNWFGYRRWVKRKKDDK